MLLYLSFLFLSFYINNYNGEINDNKPEEPEALTVPEKLEAIAVEVKQPEMGAVNPEQHKYVKEYYELIKQLDDSIQKNQELLEKKNKKVKLAEQEEFQITTNKFLISTKEKIDFLDIKEYEINQDLTLSIREIVDCFNFNQNHYKSDKWIGGGLIEESLKRAQNMLNLDVKLALYESKLHLLIKESRSTEQIKKKSSDWLITITEPLRNDIKKDIEKCFKKIQEYIGITEEDKKNISYHIDEQIINIQDRVNNTIKNINDTIDQKEKNIHTLSKNIVFSFSRLSFCFLCGLFIYKIYNRIINNIKQQNKEFENYKPQKNKKFNNKLLKLSYLVESIIFITTSIYIIQTPSYLKNIWETKI